MSAAPATAHMSPEDARFPPLPDTPAPFPTEPPLAVSLVDLASWWLSIECAPCRMLVYYPLRLMAAERGWQTQLGGVLPKLRCSKCGRPPTDLDLVDDCTGEDQRPGPKHGRVTHRLKLR